MSKQLVLITGATGHLGFKTLVFTLEEGYRARVALRRLEQAEKIRNTKSIQPYLDSIEFVQVPDITAADAYNEAIRGVDFVLHIASPIYSNVPPGEKDWKRILFDPAVRGTMSMLEAAMREPRVKRVVVTSSVAVLEPKNGSDRVGPYDLKELPNEETRNALPVAPMAYAVSKLLAHVAATEFVEQNSLHFAVIRVLPGYIQGANELYVSAEQMSDDGVLGSNEGTMNTALGKTVGHPRITAQAFLYDVAKAHVLALNPKVARTLENLLVVANGGVSTPWDQYVPIIKRLYPEAVEKGIINPGAEDESVTSLYDVESSQKALGFKFSGTEEIVKSVVGQYLSFVETA